MKYFYLAIFDRKEILQKNKGILSALVIAKAMHLMEKLVISKLIVILNFGTSLYALYNHYFTNSLPNYEAKLTQN